MGAAGIELRTSGLPIRVDWLADAAPRPRRVAIGTFDGVHLGHQRVIRGMDTVLTFTGHPRSIVGEAPELLNDLATKVERIHALGVTEIVLLPFDPVFARMSPARFVDEVLVGALGATEVAVGENFRFGHRAAGTPDTLLADPRLDTRLVPLLRRGGTVVSSTRIRELIKAGSLAEAEALLGDRFTVRCLVAAWDAAGRATSLRWPASVIQPSCDVRAAPARGGAREFGLTRSAGDGRLWHCSAPQALGPDDEVALAIRPDDRASR